MFYHFDTPVTQWRASSFTSSFEAHAEDGVHSRAAFMITAAMSWLFAAFASQPRRVLASVHGRRRLAIRQGRRSSQRGDDNGSDAFTACH
jgi:hypothetical protein